MPNECRFCDFRGCPGTKTSGANAYIVCNLKVVVPDTVSGCARRFLENARAMKFTQHLSTMKGAEVDQKLSAADARAIYNVKAALSLGSDTEQENELSSLARGSSSTLQSATGV